MNEHIRIKKRKKEGRIEQKSTEDNSAIQQTIATTRRGSFSLAAVQKKAEAGAAAAEVGVERRRIKHKEL